MIKQIVFALTALIFLIAGLIGYQWLKYENSDQQTERVQNSTLEVEADLVHKKGMLTITQKVSNLEQDSFLIKLPQNAQSIKCKLKKEGDCTITENSALQRIDVGNGAMVTFSYLLPIDENKRSSWIGNSFVQFFKDDHQEINANFNVTLSEAVNKSITWVSGAVNKGKVDKKHLSYFAWTQNNATIFPLYMTKEKLLRANTYEPNLSIFLLDTKDQNDSFKSFKNWYEKLPEQSGLTIVQSFENKQAYIAPLLVVVPQQLEVNKIEELAIQSFLLYNKKPKTKDIAWVWNLLPSFILERPLGQGKAFEMSKELLENLQPEAKKAFSKWLMERNDSNDGITLKDLDQQLSAASKLDTTFFAENQNQQISLVPLYYLDHRKVFNGNEQLNIDWNPVLRSNKILFPFIQTAEAFNFEVKEFPDSNMYLLSKDGSSWRFYFTKPYYSYNQTNYDLPVPPLELFGDVAYISEQMLEEILKIEVIKRDEVIYLR